MDDLKNATSIWVSCMYTRVGFFLDHALNYVAHREYVLPSNHRDLLLVVKLKSVVFRVFTTNFKILLDSICSEIMLFLILHNIYVHYRL